MGPGITTPASDDEVTGNTTKETPAPQPARTRRSLLAAGMGAAGAFIASAIGRPAPADAASVVLGATNNETAATRFHNTTASSSAWGLVGRSTYTGAASNARGVVGISDGTDGVGVAGQANTGAGARGVLGISNTGHGVRGSGGPTGVRGTGTNYGVFGQSTNNYGVYGDGGYAGVQGTGAYGTYGSGTSSGAVGSSATGYGVYGLGSIGVVGIGNGSGYGAWGYNADSGGYGVVGQGGYRGVYGSGSNAGLYGTSGYVGLWGVATTTTGLNFGVYAQTMSSGGYAGVFSGAVQVSGFLSKLGGGFKIDHPQDPANRYLVHSFVEAPEMLNVYGGTAALDASGKATVQLPAYFESENGDFRYQLTAIGAAMPNLHVASGVKANRFAIAGGAAGQSVSWLVTGVRQDAWAKANPMAVEPLKASTERGKFLSPKLHGKTDKDSIYPTSQAEMLSRAPQATAKQPSLPSLPAD